MEIRRDNAAGNSWLSHHTNLPYAVANKVMISLNETAVLWRRITQRLITPSQRRDGEIVVTGEQHFIKFPIEAALWAGTECRVGGNKNGTITYYAFKDPVCKILRIY